MAQRTTPAAVVKVLTPGRDYDGASDLSPFITRASLLVDRVATCASDKGEAMSAAELLDMETWLAAHFYKMADQQLASTTKGRSSDTYRAQQGKGLEATTYGMAALQGDFAGCLAAIAARRRASVDWLGKTEPEMLDYETRMM